MKKIIIIILIVVCCWLGGKTFFNKQAQLKEANIEKGWYVEITNTYINIRTEPNAYSETIGKVYEGEKYEVTEVNLDSGVFIWYHIKINDYKTGWIASSRKNAYLTDHNNPTDIAKPTIKFFNDVYYVDSIDEINYEHLEIWDDKDDYTVSHKAYKEMLEDGDHQYWIVYTVTDGVENKVSKTQKIIFLNEPKDNKVLDFDKYYSKN